MKKLIILVLLLVCLPLLAQDKGMKIKARYQNELGGHKWAVIIGINNYQDDRIGDLRYAVNDAVAISGLLTDQWIGDFEQKKVKLLTDTSPQKPTRENILTALNAIEKVASEKDTIFISFSGHGIEADGESYLLPSNSKLELLSDTGISIDRFKQPMQKSKASVQVLFFDACHSGVDLRSKGPTGQMGKNTLRRIYQNAKGQAILSSCSINQKSYEWPDKEHGVFTFYLLEALRGSADLNQDGFVSLTETANYTSEKVLEWSFETGNIQSPQWKANLTGDVVLSITQGKTPVTTLQALVGKKVDVSPPTISVIEPDLGTKQRTEITLPTNGQLTIKGNVKDDVGIDYVMVNKQKVQLNNYGNFVVEMPVKGDFDYSIVVSAHDESGKSSQKRFQLRVNSPGRAASSTGQPINSTRSKFLTDYKGKLTEGNYITFGTTKKEVLRIQGEPSLFNPTTYSSSEWRYFPPRGGSAATIKFDADGKVESWKDYNEVLKAGFTIPRISPIDQTLTVGSDYLDVLLIQGLPRGEVSKPVSPRQEWNYFGSEWRYFPPRGGSHSTIKFDADGKIESWKDYNEVLKIKWTPP